MDGSSRPDLPAEWQEFGRTVRAWREQREVSLRVLAERIRWYYTLIGKWERGKNRPPAATVAADQGRAQPDTVRRDLAHAAAHHAALIGGKWFDLSNRREAHRWWAQARALSEQSGDSLLTSWLRSWEATYRRQDPDEDLDSVPLVAREAREARRLAGDTPSAPLVAALGVEAQTLAMLGRHAEAITALHRTEEALNRLPASGSSRQGRALWYDRNLVCTLAGDAERAEDARATAEKPIRRDTARRHCSRSTARRYRPAPTPPKVYIKPFGSLRHYPPTGATPG